jgi:hypothetical protein
MTREEQIKHKAAGVGILWRDTLVSEGLDRNVAEVIASAIQKEFINTAEWADKTMLDKMCQYLFENYHGEKLSLRMIEDLRKAMEE